MGFWMAPVLLEQLNKLFTPAERKRNRKKSWCQIDRHWIGISTDIQVHRENVLTGNSVVAMCMLQLLPKSSLTSECMCSDRLRFSVLVTRMTASCGSWGKEWWHLQSPADCHQLLHDNSKTEKKYKDGKIGRIHFSELFLWWSWMLWSPRFAWPIKADYLCHVTLLLLCCGCAAVHWAITKSIAHHPKALGTAVAPSFPSDVW